MFSIFVAEIAGAVMDYIKREVYDFIWIIILAIGLGLFLINNSFSLPVLISLVIYCVIQELLMSHVYGKADCHAFCANAYIMAAYGFELEYYVLNMLVCTFLLILVQLIKRNVGSNGRLKRPVAMIPYIAASLIIMTCFVIIKRIVEFYALFEV